MGNIDIESISECLKSIAIETGRIISSVKYEDRKKFVKTGADGTPTLHIDDIAENFIISKIEELAIPLNIVSEEAGDVDRGYEYSLVLDPVDGTFNAANGIPFYSISMAIGKKFLSDIIYGLIYNPCNGDFYEAFKDRGAFFNGNPVKSHEKTGCLSINISYRKTGGKYKGLNKRYRRRAMGCASLEMAMVATGAFDAFLMLGRTVRVVDIAASTLFVREAGGIVVGPDGKTDLDKPLTIKEGFEVIAAISYETAGELLCE